MAIDFHQTRLLHCQRRFLFYLQAYLAWLVQSYILQYPNQEDHTWTRGRDQLSMKEINPHEVTCSNQYEGKKILGDWWEVIGIQCNRRGMC